MKRGINARQFTRALRKEGFENIRTRGSHHFFLHPDGRATTVVYDQGSDTFAIGMLKAMVEDVEWTEDDLRRHKFL